MPGLVTKRFRIHNAEQFYEAFSETAPSYMYIFVSRVHSWPDDNNPPTPSDNVKTVMFDVWRSMIAAKRVTSSDVSHVVPRYDWTNNHFYTQYTDTNTTLFSNNFYVLTSPDFNVYKCLYNNRGANSTVMPTGTSTSVLSTSDGYKWKYMYTISATEALKFVTANWIPVKTLSANDGSSQWLVQQAASNGSVDIIDVTANGTNYLSTNGTFASVTNSTVVVLATTANATNDVYNGSQIYITSGTGSGQVRKIVNYVGTTKTLTVNGAFSPSPTGSSTYHVGPLIRVVGDGTGALAYANVSSGQIRKVTMVNVGSKYSKATVTALSNTSHGSGASLVAYLPPTGGHTSTTGGHGKHPVEELGAFQVMLNAKFIDTEANTILTNNDFRIIGLVRNPYYSNGVLATATNIEQTTRIRVSGISGKFSEDEIVNGGTSLASARFVSFSNTNAANTAGIMRVVDVSGTFSGTETITGNTSSATATRVVSGSRAGQLKPYFGEIQYIENRSPTSRNYDQTEDIKLVVRF